MISLSSLTPHSVVWHQTGERKRRGEGISQECLIPPLTQVAEVLQADVVERSRSAWLQQAFTHWAATMTAGCGQERKALPNYREINHKGQKSQ